MHRPRDVDAGLIPPNPACEACGHRADAWRIGEDCFLWRCPACGHIMRELERCRRARSHPWGGSRTFDRVRSALTRRALRRAMPGPGPLDVVEIGFGSGELLLSFLRDGHRVTGIDPGLLETEIPPELRARGTLLAQSAEGVSLPDDAFDLIYGIHVVEHLASPADVFMTCGRALHSGGLLYLMTPNARSRGLSLFGSSWWNLEDPTHVRFFSPTSIATMLAAAGFVGVRVRQPIWDSLTMEVSSLVRTIGQRRDDHGVMSHQGLLPLYAAFVPAALAVRFVWPALRPSIEVLARKG